MVQFIKAKFQCNIPYTVLYMLEAELGSQDQAIVKRGDKMYFILSQELMQKQYVDKLREYEFS